MSNSLAIAAVTSTLRSILYEELNPAEVTTLPLDRVAALPERSRVNLFLYHMGFNAAWRNMPLPNKTRPGEPGQPPLPLNLYYLLTAYGDTTDESDHQLLGRAMSVLHDQPVLPRSRILSATRGETSLALSDLHEQIDQIKIVPEILNVDEMSRLWTTFQSQYRVSTAYQVSVVLLEGRNQRPAPLPVLRRGEDDSGPDVVASAAPVLERTEYRHRDFQRALLPVAMIDPAFPIRTTFLGRNLPRHNVEAIVRNPLGAGGDLQRLRPNDGGSENSLTFDLDPESSGWLAGQLEARLEFDTPTGVRRRSNPIPFFVAPRLVKNGTLLSYFTVPENGRRKLVLRCEPAIASERNVMLLLSGTDDSSSQNPIRLDATSANFTPESPVFDIHDVPHGRYLVRLRVDMVDSLLLFHTPERGLELDHEQAVVL